MLASTPPASCFIYSLPSNCFVPITREHVRRSPCTPSAKLHVWLGIIAARVHEFCTPQRYLQVNQWAQTHALDGSTGEDAPSASGGGDRTISEPMVNTGAARLQIVRPGETFSVVGESKPPQPGSQRRKEERQRYDSLTNAHWESEKGLHDEATVQEDNPEAADENEAKTEALVGVTWGVPPKVFVRDQKKLKELEGSVHMDSDENMDSDYTDSDACSEDEDIQSTGQTSESHEEEGVDSQLMSFKPPPKKQRQARQTQINSGATGSGAGGNNRRRATTRDRNLLPGVEPPMLIEPQAAPHAQTEAKPMQSSKPRKKRMRRGTGGRGKAAGK